MKTHMICPKCGADSYSGPGFFKDEMGGGWSSIFVCTECIFPHDSTGAPIVEDSSPLTNTFRGATEAQKFVEKFLQNLTGVSFDEKTRFVLESTLVKYSFDMWHDGFQQGLLLGMYSLHKKGEEGKDARKTGN